MRIATYNVNGINGRLTNLLGWLEQAAPGIVCLQELKAPDDKFPEAALRAAGYGAIWHLAIVFTDLVGSTALNVELGDAAMSEVRRQHFAQSTALLAKHAGYEVKTNGRHKAGSIRDGVLLDVVGAGQGCG